VESHETLCRGRQDPIQFVVLFFGVARSLSRTFEADFTDCSGHVNSLVRFVENRGGRHSNPQCLGEEEL
jgi:hypothetical protein